MILMPYNYLLDPKIRNYFWNKINFNNSLILFDEGHNITKVS